MNIKLLAPESKQIVIIGEIDLSADAFPTPNLDVLDQEAASSGAPQHIS